MKKSSLFCMISIAILLCLMLTACKSGLMDEKEANDYVDATKYVDAGRRVSFDATVLEVGRFTLMVVPDENTFEIRSADKISVSVSGSDRVMDGDGVELTLADIKVGDRVSIVYDGTILESYPARISQCYEVRLIE